jgi:hypothetical protein
MTFAFCLGDALSSIPVIQSSDETTTFNLNPVDVLDRSWMKLSQNDDPETIEGYDCIEAVDDALSGDCTFSLRYFRQTEADRETVSMLYLQQTHLFSNVQFIEE